MARWGDEGRWGGEDRWWTGRRDELRPGEQRTYVPRERGERYGSERYGSGREGWRGERWRGEDRGEGSDDWVVEPGWTRHDEDRGGRGGAHRATRDEVGSHRGARAGWYGAEGEGWRGGGDWRGGDRWRARDEGWRDRGEEHRRDYSGLSAGYGAEGGYRGASPYRDEEWRTHREAQRGYGAQARHYGEERWSGRTQHGPDYGERGDTRAWTGTSGSRPGSRRWEGERGGGWQAERERGREGWRGDEDRWRSHDDDRWRGHDSDQGWGSDRGEDYRGFFGTAPGMYASNVGPGTHGGQYSHALGERPGGPEYGGRYGGDDRGPLEKLGDKVRHGFERLTGRAPKNYRRSDERIREDVCERIARSGVDAGEVDVAVKDAEVTLSGTIHHRDDKRRIEDIAEDVFGVEQVHNQLRVDRGGTYLPAGSGQGTSGVAGTKTSGLSSGTAISSASASTTPQTSGGDQRRTDPASKH